MTPSVPEVLDRARAVLADVQEVSGEEFTDEVLLPHYKSAFETLIGKAQVHGLPKIEKTAVLTVAPNAFEIDPRNLGYVDFGLPYAAYERSSASERYVPVGIVGSLADGDPTDRIGAVEYSDGKIQLLGVTSQRQLKIRYYSNGAAPESGSVGIDGSLNYLAFRTAALALLPREEGGRLSASLSAMANEALDDWLSANVRQMQAVTITRPPFRARRR